ncbi:MAG: hypothetical protein WCS31_17295 [Verrucomicrobiae bacterium]
MKRTLLSNRFFSVAFATVILAGPASADVYFGWGGVVGGSALGSYRDFSKQGRFFSTSDYGFVPGEEDQFSGAKLGLKWDKSPPVVRGQNPVAASQLGEGFYGTPWLSGGGDCIFGLAFDEAFKPRWEKAPEQQFAAFPDKTPRFEQAVIYWGREVPKPGTWGAGILNAEGKLLRAEVNHEPLYPYDKSTISFPATTVKKLYFGVKGGDKGDNFVEVRKIALLMHNEPQIKNSVLVDQPDAYSAYYSTAKPGEIEKLTLKSFSFPKQQQHYPFLKSIAPFVEVDGKRLYSAPGDQPAKASRQGDVDTLTYPLDFTLPDGKTARVEVATTFGADPKAAIQFGLRGSGLPKGAQVGLEMTGDARYFQNFVDDGAMVESAIWKTVSTPAGPVALSWKGNGKLSATRTTEMVNIDVRSPGENLDVTLGLPIGAEAGVQPGMMIYTTRHSLADQGDPGVAPFTSDDLELLETIHVGDPNDPYTVYDITNDPLIAKWRQSGEAKLPRKFGELKFINDPEKSRIPITKVGNESCRDLGSNETSYFRVTLKTRFEPQVPYLVVVEHAFDKERRGEFHSIAVNRDGTDWVQDDSLWHSSCPYGGFDTGKGPYPGGFRKESVFSTRLMKGIGSPPNSTISLVFSNTRVSGYFKNFEKNPDGLAIKSIAIYRVKRLPQLPDIQPLLPKEPRRHMTIDSEYLNPWMLTDFPRIYGYDSLWTHNQPASQLLHGGGSSINRPSWGSWVHPGSFQANRALYEKAASEGVHVKTTLGWLLDLGFDGTDRGSFLGFGWLPGPIWGSLPLSPTPEELKYLGSALDRSLAALAKHPSLTDIAVGDIPAFSRRNLEDFSKETGVAFQAGPLPEDNLKRLLESPQPTVEAWSNWACQKRFEFLSWLLKKARAYRPEITLTLNQSWYKNGLQGMYYTDQWPFDLAGLPNAGIKSYADFLKFVGIDPALYAKQNGFVFGVDMDPPDVLPGRASWPFEGSAEKIRDGFGGGLSVSSNFWDESSKALLGWGCNYIKDQKGFRKGIIEALLQANAREYVLQTYADPARGRLADLRELAVPFRLLPFAKPEPFSGKIEDSAKQAVIHKYGDRYGLVNPGDKPTDVTLTLPEGAATVADLSNGIRQPLAVSGDRTVKLHLKPWSLKTLEIQTAHESKKSK